MICVSCLVNSMSTLFKKKNLTPAKRICLRLKEQRLEKGVSLTAMSEKTKISKKYLIALENCQFDKLPQAAVYQKSFIKCYLKELGIAPEPFLEQFIEEEINYSTKEEDKHPKKHLRSSSFSNLPNLIRFVAIFLIVLFFVLYLSFQIKNILEPPILTLLSPQNGYVSESSSIVVRGETENGVSVSINDKGISINEDGQFEEIIDLNQGLNTITITAEKKHGKKTIETRHVIMRKVE